MRLAGPLLCLLLGCSDGEPAGSCESPDGEFVAVYRRELVRDGGKFDDPYQVGRLHVHPTASPPYDTTAVFEVHPPGPLRLRWLGERELEVGYPAGVEVISRAGYSTGSRVEVVYVREVVERSPSEVAAAEATCASPSDPAAEEGGAS